MKSKAGAQINHSILDGFTILQAVVTAGRPVGGIDIARQLDMESTRVNRLLKTLASIGMVEQTSNRKYSSGPGIHVLATQSLYASGLLRSAIPELEKLMKFNLTVGMGVLWYDSVSFLFHAKPGMSSAQAIGRIGLLPATNSGIGMVLLANSHAQSVTDTYQDKDILNFPDGLASLQQQLSTIKAQGYARFQAPNQDNSNPHENFTIAVPIGTPTNSAIAVSGKIPIEQTDHIVACLQQAKLNIENALRQLKSVQ